MDVNVAICCQVHLYAEGLCKLLEEDDEINVLGFAGSSKEIEHLMEMSPDIIVTDVASRKMVLGAQADNKSKNILVINDDAAALSGGSLRSMITDGVGGLLPRDADNKMLKKAVKKLNGGELWLDRQTMSKVFSGAKEASNDIHLTKKETVILGHVCDGLSNKEIANKLYISEQTVKSHCNHLFKKFGVSSRLKLAVHAPKYLSNTLN